MTSIIPFLEEFPFRLYNKVKKADFKGCHHFFIDSS
jgi:hypothetical protein